MRFVRSTPGTANGLPTPFAMVPLPATGLLLAPSTVFAWLDPRQSPVAYELQVHATNDVHNLIIQTICHEPGYRASPGLAAGGYAWRIRPVAGALEGSWTDWQKFAVLDIPLAQRVPGEAVGPVGLHGGIPLRMGSIPHFT